ncbi:FAD/NAD(P)-binding domain-containing protein [Hypoxylon argillaceum]|nr:FAD/NAD(P)-binding domain-containing protein [Hypoxylon argillaceum]
MTGRIRIGRVGGGLAGITVAIALSKHRHVDVHVYESSPQFTERGAGIGLPPLALEAGAVEADAARLVIEMLHAGKRLKSLDQIDSGVRVRFEDGTNEHFDAVASADGIFSSVRDHDCRHLVPFEKAREALGEGSFKIDRQYAWLGDGAAMLHGLVENKTMVQCIIAVIDKSFSADRKREVMRNSLNDALPASRYEGPVAKGVVDLILDQEDPKGYAQWEHKSTPTYANNRACIVGDAAHATSPWQDAGAGISIEDAFIMGRLFSNISTAAEIEAAFKAFDALRRPRCQQMVDNGRRIGRLFCGQDETAGVDAEKLSRELGLMFGPLGAFELKLHKEDALSRMQEFLND